MASRTLPVRIHCQRHFIDTTTTHRCTTCKVQLQGNFYEHEAKPYCEECYDHQYGKEVICKFCSKRIFGSYVSALNAAWHPEHFVCTLCGDYFKDGMYYEHEGMPYCAHDIMTLLGRRYRKRPAEETAAS